MKITKKSNVRANGTVKRSRKIIAANNNSVDRLQQLLDTAENLDFYLDAATAVNDSDPFFRLSKEEFWSEMQDIVVDKLEEELNISDIGSYLSADEYSKFLDETYERCSHFGDWDAIDDFFSWRDDNGNDDYTDDDYTIENDEVEPDGASGSNQMSGPIYDYMYTGKKIPDELRAHIVSIIISKDVESISTDAFEYCTRLTSVTIPNSVTEIGYGAFSHCDSLPSVTIPDSVTSIERFAFFDCDRLTNVTIPDSVTKIRYAAFKYCSSLTIHTNNPIAIEYAEKEGIPVVPLDDGDLATL